MYIGLTLFTEVSLSVCVTMEVCGKILGKQWSMKEAFYKNSWQAVLDICEK
jgi:hypothetical protein